MKNNKENKLNKYFLYTLLCICVFTVIMLSACFIAGNTDVFKWDSSDRFLIILFTLVFSTGIIWYKEIT